MKKKLQQIGNSTDTAKNIMKYLGKRKRFRSTSDVVKYKLHMLQAGDKINPTDYFKFWADLEVAGLGKLEGKIFKWNHNFRMLEDVKEPRVYIKKAINEIRLSAERLVFVPLLSGHDFEAKLPTNLTDNDIEAIIRALRTASKLEV